jgi:DNA-binding transcriptional ArsR family regulator
MNNKQWTFLSNHGHIFAYVAQHPQATTQFMAEKLHLSIREVQMTIDDLEEAGYLTRERVGRNNHYKTNADKPLRHHLERRHTVGDLLACIGSNGHSGTPHKNDKQDDKAEIRLRVG